MWNSGHCWHSDHHHSQHSDVCCGRHSGRLAVTLTEHIPQLLQTELHQGGGIEQVLHLLHQLGQTRKTVREYYRSLLPIFQLQNWMLLRATSAVLCQARFWKWVYTPWKWYTHLGSGYKHLGSRCTHLKIIYDIILKSLWFVFLYHRPRSYDVISSWCHICRTRISQ